jgi:hypothetical protein
MERYGSYPLTSASGWKRRGGRLGENGPKVPGALPTSAPSRKVIPNTTVHGETVLIVTRENIMLVKIYQHTICLPQIIHPLNRSKGLALLSHPWNAFCRSYTFGEDVSVYYSTSASNLMRRLFKSVYVKREYMVASML